MDNMQAAQVDAVIRFARIGLTVLAARVLTLVALLGALAGFAWVLYDPHWIRAAASVAFYVLVLWPILRLETKQAKE